MLSRAFCCQYLVSACGRWLGGVCILILGGCANLNSIERSTWLSDHPQSAHKAVHLDAKQRLVFAKDTSKDNDRFLAVCAEPSPDALSAYAQSMGLSLADPTKRSASGSQASQETAASIGLRTQSITLMRDSLYRICEAYYNRALNGPQVVQALARSQDITVAVLAIEQLTGAVAAQPVVLGGNASASATGQIANIQKLLEAARTALEKETKELEKAKLAYGEAEKARDQAKQDLAKETDPEKRAVPEAILKQKENELNATGEVVKSAEKRVADAANVQKKLEENPTSAITSTNASASGSGEFGNNISVVNLNDQSAEKIAEAVYKIVKQVTDKNYRADACLAYITRNWQATDKANEIEMENLKHCWDIVKTEQLLRSKSPAVAQN